MNITKMQGLGNDFIITEEYMEDYSQIAVELCKRRVSVGADGLVVVAFSKKADAKMRIFNADGSEAEMCGNAIRCFARYLYDKKIVKKEQMSIETLAGIMKPQLIKQGNKISGVKVDMGLPIYSPQSIPVSAEDPLDFVIEVAGRQLNACCVLLGVPHTVLFGDFSNQEICELGSLIEKHELFPKKTNVNFASIIDTTHVSVRTWERGVGRTLACGTGCCSVVELAHKKGLVQSSATVLLETGKMQIDIAQDGHVFMTGPAEYVFTGETLGN